MFYANREKYIERTVARTGSYSPLHVDFIVSLCSLQIVSKTKLDKSRHKLVILTPISGRIMHSTGVQSNRSSLKSTIPTPSTTSSLMHTAPHAPQQQQQQQQILYGPIGNHVMTLPPCGTGLHPPCIYPAQQRNAGSSNSAPLHIQGESNRYQSKSKVPRGQQQFCQQQQHSQLHTQHQLSYNPKPLVRFEQPVAPPSTSSFVLASSTFAHGPFPGEHYNSSGIALIPQPYFKPPELPAFCLVQDRQNAQQQQQQQPGLSSYYNISATNTCSLQTVNANSAFQLSNLGPYATVAAFTNNQISGPVQSVQSAQIYPGPSIGLVFGAPPREKLTVVPTLDSAASFKAIGAGAKVLPSLESEKMNELRRAEDSSVDWPNQASSSASTIFDARSRSAERRSPEIVEDPLEYAGSDATMTRTQEERYSDESSNGFDFTIEAEKMVSALCNTTSSNDLGKDAELRNETKFDSMTLFNGGGDNGSNRNTWFADLCGICAPGGGKSVAIQTDQSFADRSQYPELMRKTAFWGCTEAEMMLKEQKSARVDWMKKMLAATKVAIAKSSTCFPVFAGNRVFANDLANALLRISNGWLILDNYLNKQHYPNLAERLDRELVGSFQAWEESTYDLLKLIVPGFLKLDESIDLGSTNSETRNNEAGAMSFPGDVSLYTSSDLLDPSPIAFTGARPRASTGANDQDNARQFVNSSTTRLSTESSRNSPQGNANAGTSVTGVQQSQKVIPSKEAKARSKWTIAETPLTSTIETAKDILADVSSPGQRQKSNVASAGGKVTAGQSLNAEFAHLRNKVMESSQESSRNWTSYASKKQQQELFGSAAPSTAKVPQPTLLRIQSTVTNKSYATDTFAQKCLPMVGTSFASHPVSNVLQSCYVGTANNIGTNGTESNPTSCSGLAYAMSCYNATNNDHKCPDQNYMGKLGDVDPIYFGKSSSDQLAIVPRNKMTLLSQIEPSTPEKESEEMTANLSAWFASMRNAGGYRHSNPTDSKTIDTTTTSTTTTMMRNKAAGTAHQEMTRNTMDLTRQLQLDANRQLQTLQNMQSIQSAPWNACNLIANQSQVQQVFDEYDSSEDVRVYMKPGSYNVPKKRYQRKTNRKSDNSSASRNINAMVSVSARQSVSSNKDKGGSVVPPASSSTLLAQGTVSSFCATVDGNTCTTEKIPFPSTTPSAASPEFSLENSPRILRRANSSTISEAQQDVAWKAACASAEILLEALNVKKGIALSSTTNETRVDENEKACKDDKLDLPGVPKQDTETLRLMKRGDAKCVPNVSSYEASEDDSGSTSKLSPSTSVIRISQMRENKNGTNKTNVKTDSWLIRTLNNASIVSKQKRHKNKNIGLDSSDSSNSSLIDNDQTVHVSSLTAVSTSTTITTTSMIEKREQMSNLAREISYDSGARNEQTLASNESAAGKATYSETVRRSAASQLGKKESNKKGKSGGAGASTICATIVPIPGRRLQRKDTERPYHLLHKSRKASGKKTLRNSEYDSQVEDTLCSKLSDDQPELVSTIMGTYCKEKCVGTFFDKYGAKKYDRGASTMGGEQRLMGKVACKKKDAGVSSIGAFLDKYGTCKSHDRGWSVWYSSKRKQGLSSLAQNKLETMYQVICKMSEAEILKYPSTCNPNGGQSAAGTIEHYCKVIKSPIFLEDVGYKLKNRLYHKVEHVVKDFRRIVYNAKLYNNLGCQENDSDRAKKVKIVSKKLEELLEEHFASWEFGSISESPREGSPTLQQFKSISQKSIVGRYNSIKKSPSS